MIADIGKEAEAVGAGALLGGGVAVMEGVDIGFSWADASAPLGDDVPGCGRKRRMEQVVSGHLKRVSVGVVMYWIRGWEWIGQIMGQRMWRVNPGM